MMRNVVVDIHEMPLEVSIANVLSRPIATAAVSYTLLSRGTNSGFRCSIILLRNIAMSYQLYLEYLTYIKMSIKMFG